MTAFITAYTCAPAPTMTKCEENQVMIAQEGFWQCLLFAPPTPPPIIVNDASAHPPS